MSLAASAMALLLVSIAFPSPAMAGKGERPGLLRLSATGEVTAPADMAVVTLGVEKTAKTAQEALAANTRAMRKVFALLKERWKIPERDMMTSGFSVSPVYETEKLPNGRTRQRLVGYRVSNMLTVRIRRLEALGEILDGIVQAGSNRVNSIRFTLENPDALEQEARRKAVRKALAKARLLAEEAGFRLGPIREMSENVAGFQPIPVPMFRTKGLLAKSASMPVPVAAGESKVRVTVNVTWEIH